jgi:hypothetical protein
MVQSIIGATERRRLGSGREWVTGLLETKEAQ